MKTLFLLTLLCCATSARADPSAHEDFPKMPERVFALIMLHALSVDDPSIGPGSAALKGAVPVLSDDMLDREIDWAEKAKSSPTKPTDESFFNRNLAKANEWREVFKEMDKNWADDEVTTPEQKAILVKEAQDQLPEDVFKAFKDFRHVLEAPSPLMLPGMLDEQLQRLGVIRSQCSQSKVGEQSEPPKAKAEPDLGGYEWNRGRRTYSTTYYPSHSQSETKEGRIIKEGGPCSALGMPLVTLEAWTNVEIPQPRKPIDKSKGETQGALECDIQFSSGLPPDYVSVAGRFSAMGSAMRFDFHNHPGINEGLEGMLKKRNEKLAEKQSGCRNNPDEEGCPIILAMKPANFIPFRITDTGAADLFADGHFDICRSPADPNAKVPQLAKNPFNQTFIKRGKVPMTPIWIKGDDEKEAFLAKVAASKSALRKTRKKN